MEPIPPVLELAGVGVRFGSEPELLADIGLVLRGGTVTVVTGAPGAGKSLLLAVAALALRPSRGQVRLFGEPAAGATPSAPMSPRRRIGWVEAAPTLVDGLDAVDNAALPLRIGGMARAEARARAAEMVAWLGGGAVPTGRVPPAVARRIALARATVNDPGLVLIDDADRLEPEALRRLPTLIERLCGHGTATLMAITEAIPACAVAGATWLRLERGRLRSIDATITAPRRVEHA